MLTLEIIMNVRAVSLSCLVLAASWAVPATMEASVAKDAREGRVRSADGVEIAYVARGAGATALVLIHGGMADHTFWHNQLDGLSDRFQVVALDLGGHGESGRNRAVWSIPAWAQDVRAVVDALHLRRVVLVGNSLGGPVALEAAALLPGRVLGVVGVDTLQNATQKITVADANSRADAFRKDFKGTCHGMVGMLFHPGTQEKLRAWVERRMCAMPPEVVVGMMAGFGGFDMSSAFRHAGVPIRVINGDLFPTRTELNRTVVADFDATIMRGCGHFPMLERPAEFNRILSETVAKLQPAARMTK
jgi:pimeloyl-ACP methyl ester carboxylesterase